MDISLKGKRALLGGSSQGIGLAAAKELATLGATVTLVARNEALLQEAHAALPRPEGQVHDYLVADFHFPGHLQDKLREQLEQVEGYHILVNNSGGPPPGQAIDASIEDFEQALRHHLLVNHTLVQTLLPFMKAQQYGRIINIISTSVKEPIPGLGVSNTTRGAVASWAKTLSSELGGYGVTVNNVLPGLTATERLFSLIETLASKHGRSRSEQEEAMKNSVPVGRFAAPSELGNVVGFLASPAAAYLNGISIRVDGGRSNSI